MDPDEIANRVFTDPEGSFITYNNDYFDFRVYYPSASAPTGYVAGGVTWGWANDFFGLGSSADIASRPGTQQALRDAATRGLDVVVVFVDDPSLPFIGQEHANPEAGLGRNRADGAPITMNVAGMDTVIIVNVAHARIDYGDTHYLNLRAQPLPAPRFAAR